MDTLTAADLRAEIARHRLHMYLVAARARMHPMTLSRLLSGKRALTAQYTERILQAILAEAGNAP